MLFNSVCREYSRSFNLCRLLEIPESLVMKRTWSEETKIVGKVPGTFPTWQFNIYS